MPANLSVAQILREYVTLAVESLDRMYLNVYVPSLQYASGVAGFFRYHRGQTFPRIVRSTALVNQYYLYALHQDFGPFCLKFCSYAPYTA
jgi:hypothetical protein